LLRGPIQAPLRSAIGAPAPQKLLTPLHGKLKRPQAENEQKFFASFFQKRSSFFQSFLHPIALL
jgi:hypothetical protein